jgi:hypothetical protein
MIDGTGWFDRSQASALGANDARRHARMEYVREKRNHDFQGWGLGAAVDHSSYTCTLLFFRGKIAAK